MFPKCFPYWIVEGKKILNKEPYSQGVAYANGFLLPCCWCDQHNQLSDFKKLGFFDDKLRVDNNSIEDIVLSDTWKKFRKQLLDNENVPWICQHKCKEYPYDNKRQ
mgnify:CR=1 FL=1